MKRSNVHILFLLAASTSLMTCQLYAQERRLSSGTFFVTQSWSQEQNYRRAYHVRVPRGKTPGRLPVFLFLHGNGGNAEKSLDRFLQTHPKMAAQYIMVFPEGYLKSWNIVSERSQADDRAFIEQIVMRLSAHENVERNNFSIMGNSNGAALVNQLAIECKLPHIKNYVTAVSPLNQYQHDGKNFRAKGKDNSYRSVAKPVRGKRIMNISGTEDKLVPYDGGLSNRIPAKGGKLGFVAAEESIYRWARAFGATGEKIVEPRREGKLEIFSYLDGDVVHYKVKGEGHGAARAISEQRLLDFLHGAAVNSRD